VRGRSCALQRFRICCSALGVIRRESSSRVSCSFRVTARSGTVVIGLTVPLCRWPFPRLCGLP
jgi:hypothetical protein